MTHQQRGRPRELIGTPRVREHPSQQPHLRHTKRAAVRRRTCLGYRVQQPCALHHRAGLRLRGVARRPAPTPSPTHDHPPHTRRCDRQHRPPRRSTPPPDDEHHPTPTRLDRARAAPTPPGRRPPAPRSNSCTHMTKGCYTVAVPDDRVGPATSVGVSTHPTTLANPLDNGHSALLRCVSTRAPRYGASVAKRFARHGAFVHAGPATGRPRTLTREHRTADRRQPSDRVLHRRAGASILIVCLVSTT